MKCLNAKSSNYYTTPQRQATPAETKPLPRSPIHTGGQECARGLRITLRDVQPVNKIKTSPIAHAPRYIASLPQKTPSRSSRQRLTLSQDCRPMAPTTQC